MSALQIALAYTLFAMIATGANLGAQVLALKVYGGPAALMASIIVGTGVGLVVKYILDKRYIFRFLPRDARDDGRTFVLYSITGLMTTAVFWGFELGFYWAFGTEQAKFTGAALGLAMGYVAKYRLDKRHVFTERAAC